MMQQIDLAFVEWERRLLWRRPPRGCWHDWGDRPNCPAAIAQPTPAELRLAAFATHRSVSRRALTLSLGRT
jgi:hypothetical protein